MKAIIGYGCLLVLVTTQMSCSNYVYSPAVLISQKTLDKGAVDIKGGLGIFPKVKPGTPYTTEGGVLDIGYGFTNRINLYVNAWSDLSTDQFFQKAGVSFSSRISLWHDAKSEVVLYPRYALLKNGEKFDAQGFQLSSLYIRTLPHKLYTYMGIAGITGNRALNENSSKDEKLYGVLGHIALGYQPTPYFRIMAEINPIYQYNKYYETWTFILSPTVAIGYLIGMSPNEESKYKSKQRNR